MNLTAEELGDAAFGGFDGLSGTMGVLLGLIATHASPGIVLGACAAGAAGNAVSMASGQYLGDRGGPGRVRRAAVMGVATLLGALAPALPYALLPGALGIALAAVVIGAAAIVISHLRPDHAGIRAYAQTFALLIAAGGAAWGAAHLGGLA